MIIKRNIFKSVLEGAVRGLNDAVKNDIPSDGKEEIILGTIKLGRIFESNVYGNKDCVLEIGKNLKVSIKEKSGGFFRELDNKFEPTDACPSRFTSFKASGLIENSGLIEGTVVGTDGKLIKGKILIEIESW